MTFDEAIDIAWGIDKVTCAGFIPPRKRPLSVSASSLRRAGSTGLLDRKPGECCLRPANSP